MASLVIFLLIGVLSSSFPPVECHKCERIAVPMCMELGYNLTVMPNLVGHEDQQQAERALQSLMPLIHYNCSRHLRFFLCSVFVPLCSEHVVGAIPSCQALCLDVQSDCQPIMDTFNFAWPAHFNCSRFPVGEKKGLCMEFPGERSGRKRIGDPRLEGVLECPQGQTLSRGPRSNCRPLCQTQARYTDQEKLFAERWNTGWAWLAFLSTLFTLLTFWVDPNRFRYPERPIVFLGACYWVRSMVYMVRGGLEAPLSCVAEGDGYLSYQAGDGLESPTCALTFLLVYTAGLSASVWWFLLSLSWYLTAAHRWSSEALYSLATYFHLAAWALPAFVALLALVLHRVVGDELTGLCRLDDESLGWLVVGAEGILVIGGAAVGVLSARALVIVRSEILESGGSTGKLERLMRRLALLGVLYLLPALASLAITLYLSLTGLHSAPLELLNSALSLALGVSSGVWVWSGKTCRAWTKLFSPPRAKPRSLNLPGV